MGELHGAGPFIPCKPKLLCCKDNKSQRGEETHGEHLSLHRAAARRQRACPVDTLKTLSLDNCKFANVVMLSEEKLVAQLDCGTRSTATRRS
jgi:hypothetical protein